MWLRSFLVLHLDVISRWEECLEAVRSWLTLQLINESVHNRLLGRLLVCDLPDCGLLACKLWLQLGDPVVLHRYKSSSNHGSLTLKPHWVFFRLSPHTCSVQQMIYKEIWGLRRSHRGCVLTAWWLLRGKWQMFCPRQVSIWIAFLDHCQAYMSVVVLICSTWA